jgi:hypothetical protein
MIASGLVIDPTQVTFAGQSLGAIQGTVDVATNPRINRAVLNVGGGTVVDIFATSPAFATQTNQLLATLGIVPGTAGYLQFLVVAKTILDPADPVNFSGHLIANTLPNLLPPLGGNTNGSVPQAAKQILTQMPFCDQVVPNPFEFILNSNILCGGAPIEQCPAGQGNAATPGQLPYGTNFGAGTGDFQLFWNGSTGGAPNSTKLAACPAPPTPGGSTPGAVTHGFITDWVDPGATTQVQAAASSFLTTGNQQPSLVVVP